MVRVDVRVPLKVLRKLPHYIIDKLYLWVDWVEKFGLRKVRETPGYHDEPLRGDRIGQRSIRLSRSYRAIYTEYKSGAIEIIVVEEVHKHEY